MQMKLAKYLSDQARDTRECRNGRIYRQIESDNNNNNNNNNTAINK
jgi:hypothetical protein